MSKYNVHGGHNPSGKIACGAKGLLDESKEDRLIANEIIRLLKLNGHTAYNCTVSNGKSQRDVLVKICTKCNAHIVKYDISVHLNSGRNDKKGDKKVGGFEVWVTGTGNGKGTVASRIRKNMKALGFTDRGTKKTSGLYYLNHTKNSALLLEICFVDDKDDYLLYKKVGYKKVAQAVVKGLLNKNTIKTQSTVAKVASTVVNSGKKTATTIKAGAENVKVVVTATDGLNVREKRDVSSKKLGTLPKGKEITLLYVSLVKDGSLWASIDYGKNIGFINAKYVKLA